MKKSKYKYPVVTGRQGVGMSSWMQAGVPSGYAGFKLRMYVKFKLLTMRITNRT